jgi:hypothetical protein
VEILQSMAVHHVSKQRVIMPAVRIWRQAYVL